MKRCYVFTAIALAVFAISPSAAGPTASQGESVLAPRSADLSNRNISDAEQARQITNDFATCMLKRTPRAVERAAALQSAKESYGALSKLASSECLGSVNLKMPMSLLRGATYRALYIREYRNAEPKVASSPINYMTEAGQDEFLQKLARLNSFGSCVARANPEASRKLVLATVATEEEKAAIDALRPHLADCLPGGTSVKFSKASLQGLIAEVLFREAEIPVSAARGNK